MTALESYATEVKEMRRLQARYFQTRDRGVLAAAKLQERKVDELTQEIINAM